MTDTLEFDEEDGWCSPDEAEKWPLSCIATHELERLRAIERLVREAVRGDDQKWSYVPWQDVVFKGLGAQALREAVRSPYTVDETPMSSYDDIAAEEVSGDKYE